MSDFTTLQVKPYTRHPPVDPSTVLPNAYGDWPSKVKTAMGLNVNVDLFEPCFAMSSTACSAMFRPALILDTMYQVGYRAISTNWLGQGDAGLELCKEAMVGQMQATINSNGAPPTTTGQTRQPVLNNFQAVYDWTKPLLTVAREGNTYCTDMWCMPPCTPAFDGSPLGWTASTLFTSSITTPTTSTTVSYSYSAWSNTGNPAYYASLSNLLNYAACHCGQFLAYPPPSSFGSNPTTAMANCGTAIAFAGTPFTASSGGR